MWFKASPTPVPVITDGFYGQPGTNVLLGGGTLDTNPNPGFRITGAYALDGRWGVEAIGFYVPSRSTSRSVSSNGTLESIDLLAAAASNFSARCIEGLTATDRGPQLVEQGLMLATALAPLIGYDAAASLAKDALKSGRTIRELGIEHGLDPAELDRVLDPAAMTEPGLGSGSGGTG